MHYAFHRYEKTEQCHFWQLTSSSACNIPPGKSLGKHVLENVLPWLSKWIRRWHLGSFYRENGGYLLPDTQKKNFITADTNIGLLVLDSNGQPKESKLYCYDNKIQSSSIWRYDLKKPKLLES